MPRPVNYVDIPAVQEEYSFSEADIELLEEKWTIPPVYPEDPEKITLLYSKLFKRAWALGPSMLTLEQIQYLVNFPEDTKFVIGEIKERLQRDEGMVLYNKVGAGYCWANSYEYLAAQTIKSLGRSRGHGMSSLTLIGLLDRWSEDGPLDDKDMSMVHKISAIRTALEIAYDLVEELKGEALDICAEEILEARKPVFTKPEPELPHRFQRQIEPDLTYLL